MLEENLPDAWNITQIEKRWKGGFEIMFIAY